MEFIIGCIVLTVLLIILFVFCKNVSLTVEIKYPEVHIEELPELYKADGELKEEDKNQVDFDGILKEINDLMLDREDRADG